MENAAILDVKYSKHPLSSSRGRLLPYISIDLKRSITDTASARSIDHPTYQNRNRLGDK